MPTIHDIARIAEVSIATVSRVLNGRADVREETRQRVLDVSRDLNYRPHVSARNLRRRRGGGGELRYAVGLLMFGDTIFNSAPFFADLAASVENALRERGVALRLLSLNPDGQAPDESETQDVDGVICWGAAPAVKQIGQRLPAVTVNVYEPRLEVFGVAPDYRGGARIAVERLLAAGHRRILLLTGSPRADRYGAFAEEIDAGAQEAYRQFGVEPPSDLHPAEALTADAGYKAGLRLLPNPKRRPDALIASDGAMLGVCRAAYELGLRIPDDVSLIGVDGIQQGEYFAPPLTTVDTRIAEMGAAAVRALLEMIETGRRRRGVETIEPRLLVRASARI